MRKYRGRPIVVIEGPVLTPDLIDLHIMDVLDDKDRLGESIYMTPEAYREYDAMFINQETVGEK